MRARRQKSRGHAVTPWAALAILVVPLGIIAGVAPVRAAVDRFEPPAWRLRLGASWSALDGYDLFGREDLNVPAVVQPSLGPGLVIGRRLGDRFLVDIRLGYWRFATDQSSDFVTLDVELDATLELRPHARWRPYLIGGIGGFGAGFDEGDHTVTVFGALAAFGFGSRHYLTNWLSLELEVLGLAWNRRRARRVPAEDVPGDTEEWDLRGESFGWRVDAGLSLWF